MKRAIKAAVGAVAGVVISVATTAAAANATDMGAFNEAAQRGDFVAASAAAQEIWPGFDKTHSATATVAREFAFASMMAGDYEAAQSFATFLVEDGAGLPSPDDQPLTSQVILKMAEFQMRPRERRRDALFEALEARVAGDEGVDMISLLASSELFAHDWREQEWLDAGESAGLSATLNGRAGEEFLDQQRASEIAAIAADHINTRNPVAFVAMADLHDAIAADIDRLTDNPMQPALWPLLDKSLVWAEAMRMYHRTYDPEKRRPATGTRILGNETSFASVTTGRGPGARYTGWLDDDALDQLEERDLANPDTLRPGADLVSDDPRPLCDGELRGMGDADYPGGAAFQGITGAAYVRYAVDEEGDVYDAEVLAAVPSDTFKDAIMRTTPRWRVRPADGADLTQCRLATPYATVLYSFYIR